MPPSNEWKPRGSLLRPLKRRKPHQGHPRVREEGTRVRHRKPGPRFGSSTGPHASGELSLAANSCEERSLAGLGESTGFLRREKSSSRISDPMHCSRSGRLCQPRTKKPIRCPRFNPRNVGIHQVRWPGFQQPPSSQSAGSEPVNSGWDGRGSTSPSHRNTHAPACPRLQVVIASNADIEPNQPTSRRNGPLSVSPTSGTCVHSQFASCSVLALQRNGFVLPS